MKILHNHLGYAVGAAKTALIQSSHGLAFDQFSLLDQDSGELVLRGTLQALGSVERWRDWQYWSADFSALQAPGRYLLSLGPAAPVGAVATIDIRPVAYDQQVLSDLLHYFKSQRCSGVFDDADSHCPVIGSTARVDVHGGWYDASGDTSKYLSHLSYANFMNPQQTPLLVWGLMAGRDAAGVAGASMWMDERIVDEALHGADFLVRMQHPDGYFYMTVFDKWSKDVAQRQICSYTTQQGHLFDSYQAGWRQGGGMAIAALARASQLPRQGAFARQRYLQAAEHGFAHLSQHGDTYLDDGQPNLIDDHCALLAASELFAATGLAAYGEAAAERAECLLARQDGEGWFWADDARSRSFFHASDAGLPQIAWLRFLELMPTAPCAQAVLQGLLQSLRAQLAISQPGPGNPFGYPRQQVRMPGREPQTRFFIPHDNESGYWWQGENARLASLAAAASWAARLPQADAELGQALRRHAAQALDWIFGCNPFDACMMQGQGRNNPRYEAGFWNAPGGVCNGITAGLLDESDIDFRMPWQTEPRHSWRWSEQWLPHGAWLFLALSLQ